MKRKKFGYEDDQGRKIEVFLMGNMLDRHDGPAQIIFSEGRVVEEAYFRKGIRHNENGAAVVQKDEAGNVRYQENWINGQFYGRTGVKRGA